MAAFGDLAQWLSLRGVRGGQPDRHAQLPKGDGPLILMVGEAPGLAQALRRRRRGVRLAQVGPPGAGGEGRGAPVLAPLPTDAGPARALIERTLPAALVLADGTIPAALIAACDDAGAPVTLIADRHQIAAAAARTAWRGLRRGPLVRLARVLVPDRAAEDAAMRAGIAPPRIEIVGLAAPVATPLRCNLREYAALRPMLANRHVWLAAALPAVEAPAVMAAQRAVLSSHHRALLIAAPVRPEDAAPIAAAAEAAGLTVARRDQDEEPDAEVNVLVAEDSAELGLWYRLAPVAFMGGTLIAGEATPRHPHEPAGLGAAILHGPHLATHAELWRALDDAGGARVVRNAVQLGTAIEELGAPDLAARLALAAWQQATAGAEVSRRIAEAVLSDLPDTAPGLLP
ncbi:3-deoxy-D-manno-octulosonic acid transferase [Paracoccus panacisoli]|uniref:3-deoxy-D-manno-octulosonic acid transferase n=1 Tax=Paracoccus panacisoli TaxID=1510163 RepID=A0ABV6T1R9_9RHOB